MHELLSPTFVTVMLGSLLLGAVAGIIGCFALLRKQSLLGDALAHASLPGVCLGFLVSGQKDPLALLLGALIAGLSGALFVVLVVRGSRIKEDSAIGTVLSVYFGLGVVLLTFIQRMPSAERSGLDSFLFGQAATLLTRDVYLVSAVGGAVLLVVLAFYKEFKLLCFDRAFGAIVGFPMRRLEVVLTLLLVAVVVIGLQTVGVVLMIAALITPAAAARQWTDRLGVMLALGGAIGAFASACGVSASALVDKLPTGPAIVLTSSGVLVLSLLFAPRRGLLGAALRARRLAKRIRRENLLKDLYRWGEQHADFQRAASVPLLMGMRGFGGRKLQRVCAQLVAEQMIERADGGLRLTDAGRMAAANVVRKHRLWELYLTRRMELPTDHVHRDAEAMEHALTDTMADEFAALLGDPEVDPHGRPIPQREPTASAARSSSRTREGGR